MKYLPRSWAARSCAKRTSRCGARRPTSRGSWTRRERSKRARSPRSSRFCPSASCSRCSAASRASDRCPQSCDTGSCGAA
eukprot:4873984-Prymnesium_polylepis.1